MAHQPDVVVTFVADPFNLASWPRPRWGYGQSYRVDAREACTLAEDGLAVAVDVRKLGRAQRRLLVHLLHREREVREAAVRQDSRRLRRPGAEWSITAIQALEERPAARPVYTDALAALARRGLVVRLDKARAVREVEWSRTRRAQLSDAGRWIARALEQDPELAFADLEAMIGELAPHGNS